MTIPTSGPAPGTGPGDGRDDGRDDGPGDRPGDRPGDEAGDEPGVAGAGTGTGRSAGRTSGRSAGRAVGNGLGTGAKATAKGVRGAARATGRASTYTVRQARRAASAEGAEQSGLSRLIELHACNAGGDAAVAISLAGTLFFAGATSDARGQVALFLALTMLPFAIVAPLIGPFLDRFSHGRRWAMGSTFALRGFLCWVLADAVANDSPWLFPAALGVLVSSKAYGVTRAAAVPRLLPQDLTLVKANARVSLAGVVGAAIAAPFAGLAATVGPEWSLRFAFLVFVLGTVAAIRLPDKVDATAGEQEMVLRDPDGKARRRGTRIPPAVSFALRANCGPRWLSGFLTMFMAFLLRDNPIGDYAPELLLAVVIGGAGLGNTMGILTASLIKNVNPSVTVVLALVAEVVAVVLTGLFYSILMLGLLGLTAGLAQALAKVSLDATIQVSVPPRVQASAFARSDTTLQLAWVIGGFVGIALPLYPRLGLGVAAVVLVGWTAFVLATHPQRRRPGTAPARA